MIKEFHFYDIPLERTYVRLKEKYRINLFTKLRDKVDKKELFKILDCCPVSLNNWRIGYRSIPSIIIFKILKLINEKRYNIKNIEKNITHLYSGRKTKKQGSIGKSIANPKFPLKISPKLSRLIACIIGDGSIKTDWYFNTIYCNKEKILINKIIEDASDVFGKFKYNIGKGKDEVYYVNLPSIIGMILSYWFGDFSSKNARVPNQILNSNNELIKCNFLQGIFDDEGTVDRKSKVVKIYLSNGLLIKGIHKLLKDIEIKPTKIYSREYISKVNKIKGIIYTVGISNRGSINLFNNKISFIHPKKQSFLEKIII